jgi:hypothetical protein
MLTHPTVNPTETIRNREPVAVITRRSNGDVAIGTTTATRTAITVTVETKTVETKTLDQTRDHPDPEKEPVVRTSGIRLPEEAMTQVAIGIVAAQGTTATETLTVPEPKTRIPILPKSTKVTVGMTTRVTQGTREHNKASLTRQ